MPSSMSPPGLPVIGISQVAFSGGTTEVSDKQYFRDMGIFGSINARHHCRK